MVVVERLATDRKGNWKGEEGEKEEVVVGRSHWLYSVPKTTPRRMIDSSGLFVSHWPFCLLSPSMAPLATHERLSQVPETVV